MSCIRLKLFAISPGIGPRMERRLWDYGILTVQDLCARSKDEMKNIWGGVTGERFYEWLRGEDVQLRESVHRSLGHQHVLEPEFRNSEGAWRVAKKLLVKAASRVCGCARKDLMPVASRCTSVLWEIFIGKKASRLRKRTIRLTLLSALKSLWSGSPPKGIFPFRIGVTFSGVSFPKERHQLSLLVPTRTGKTSAKQWIE